MSFLEQVKESFLELLFPDGLSCPACDAEICEGLLCGECMAKIVPIEKPCPRCGRNTLGGDGFCSSCKSRIPYFDGGASACEYDGAAKALLGRLKNGHRYAAKAVAALMLDAFKGSFFEFDVVTCVPVTPKVKRIRGYNQSLLLAQIIATNLEKELDGQSLVKSRDTAYQKDLPASRRHANIEGAFKLTDRNAFSGKKVLLVDDVMTTGSTLSECAKVLKKGGASAVFCLTFASVGESVKLD